MKENYSLKPGTLFSHSEEEDKFFEEEGSMYIIISACDLTYKVYNLLNGKIFGWSSSYIEACLEEKQLFIWYEPK